MRTILLVALFVSLTLTQIIPCGRCVGKYAVCARDFCTYNLKCNTRSTMPDAAPLCYPVVARNQTCNTTLYDPCESNFQCTQTGATAQYSTCQPSQPYSGLGDNCMSSLYCIPPLICTGGTCNVQNPGTCTSDTECPFNQYCAFNSMGTSSCAPMTPIGGNCSTTGQCVYGGICKSGGCIAYFSQPLGADCSTAGNVECVTGLYCNSMNQCDKPPYHLLLGPGAIWGPSCIPSVQGSSCICNYATASYQQLKESSISATFVQNVYPNICQQRFNDLSSCITKNGCSGINIGADTCFRNKCYSFYIAAYRDCIAIGGVFPFCGANSLIVMFLLVILALLI